MDTNQYSGLQDETLWECIQTDDIAVSDDIIQGAKDDNNDCYCRIGDEYSHKEEHISYLKALDWYQKAAVKGSAEALYKIGMFHYNGNGVVKSSEAAMDHFKRAAMREHHDAEFKIGWMYFFGESVALNYDTAMTWFNRAANKGHADAQYWMGRMYHRGHGVDVDIIKAIGWYSKATVHGDCHALYAIGTFYSKGQGVAQDHDMALKCYLKAADYGSREAQYKLGVLYMDGETVEKNEQDGKKWLIKAANQRHRAALYRLGEYHYQKQEYKTALKLLVKSAKQKYPSAQYRLGHMYRCGEGVAQDHNQARVWIEQAASKKNMDAELELGKILYEAEDYKAGVEWLKKAALQGSNEACHLIGLAYLDGNGVTKKSQVALDWFNKAELLGNPDSAIRAQPLLLKGYKARPIITENDNDKAQNDEDDDMDMIKSKYITLQSQIATLRNENKTIRRENKTIFMRYDKAKKERNSELNKQKATNSTLKMEIIDKDNMITSLRQRIAELLTRRENREEMELIHQQNQEIQTRFEQMELMIEQLTERVKETNTEDAVSELDEYSSDEQEYNSSYYDTENDPDEVASESEEEGEVSC